jgi:hypothetical protein
LDAQRADRFDERQPRPDRSLGIVLVRLRIAELDQHPIAHVLGHEAVEPGDRLRDALVIGPDIPPGRTASYHKHQLDAVFVPNADGVSPESPAPMGRTLGRAWGIFVARRRRRAWGIAPPRAASAGDGDGRAGT